jgi:predicted SprT family Zn-dependent metalloprotease
MILQDAEALAHQLMSVHGLSHWHFRFDRAVRRFGFCRYRVRRITLSKRFTLLNSEPEIRNTILHEIAHALVGPHHGHGRAWRAKARELGCNGSRCCDRSVVAPSAKWVAECPGCRRVVRRHRRAVASCGQCSGGSFDPRYRLTGKHPLRRTRAVLRGRKRDQVCRINAPRPGAPRCVVTCSANRKTDPNSTDSHHWFGENAMERRDSVWSLENGHATSDEGNTCW